MFNILRARLGHDFSAYKANTLCRRIARRMSLNQIDRHETYVRYLRDNPDEVDALFRELLIGVTAFFRDAEVFEALQDQGLPELIERLPREETLRAWVPGCSSGEEVYSLAMVIREYLDTLGKRIELQLFGTDIDRFAIDKARSGLYPASIAADVGEERLKRFFSAEDDHYRIRKEVRDQVVFSVQDLLMDPPFSRLHLLCCRNVLIYFDASAQKKLLPLFHYTLAPGGLLVLGSSETIGGFSHLFAPVDKKRKIFRRLDTAHALRHELHFPSGSPSGGEAGADRGKPVVRLEANLGEQAREAILARFAPAAVLVSADGEVLHLQGRMGKYLELPTGPVSHNIVDLAREGLRIELSSALRAARSARKPVVRRRIQVRTNGAAQLIDLHVLPQNERRELRDHLLVAFQDVEPEAAPSSEAADGETAPNRSRIAELEHELQLNRETHQSTVEELESSNEELKSYRTTDNRIDGAVLTFSGVDDQKATEQRLNALAEENTTNQQLMREVFDMNTEALVILDEAQVVVSANRAFVDLAGSSEASIRGSNLFDWLSDATDPGDLGARLANAAESERDFARRSVVFRFADTPRTFDVHGRIIRGSARLPYRVLLRLAEPATRGKDA